MGQFLSLANAHSVPDNAAQAAAAKLIKSTYASDYADRTSAGRSRLAETLLQQAQNGKDEPAVEYVLLQESRELAIASGNVTTAMMSIDLMAADFQIKASDLRIAALRKLAGTGDPKELADAWLDMARDAVVADDYSLALRAASEAESVGRRARDHAFEIAMRTRSSEVRELEREWRGMNAETQGAGAPGPAANLAMGKFYCFEKGDWDRGLPMLAKAEDVSMGPLARMDLATMTASELALPCADGWWKISESLTGRAKSVVRYHAAELYRNALDALKGLEKLKIEHRIADIGPAPTSYGLARRGDRGIDLLALIDPARDAIAGKWVREGATLHSPAIQMARIEIPYNPPEEYDFAIEFARVAGNDTVMQHLTTTRTSFGWALGAFTNTVSGFDRIDGKNAAENPTTVHRGIPDNQRHTSLVQIRRDRIAAYFDGKLLTEYHTDFSNVSEIEEWPFRNHVLGIGTFESEYVIYKAELVEVRGHGKPNVTPAGLYDGEHPNWKGPIHLDRDGRFARTGADGGEDGGTWDFDGVTLNLKWANWPAEALTPDHQGGFEAVAGLRLIRHKK